MLDKLFKKKSVEKAEPSFEPPAATEGHGAALTADPFAYHVSHKRQVWLLRLSVALNVILGAVTVMLGYGYTYLIPLKTVEVALVRADPKTDKIYRVEPINEHVQGYDLLLETMSRDYVQLLLPIDEITQTKRFEQARLFSTTEFFNKFLQLRKDEVARAIKDGLNRSIVAESASQIDFDRGVYQYSVDFVQTDRLGKQPPITKKYRAYLKLRPMPHEATEADKFVNPLGIRVLDMVVKDIKNEA